MCQVLKKNTLIRSLKPIPLTSNISFEASIMLPILRLAAIWREKVPNQPFLYFDNDLTF